MTIQLSGPSTNARIDDPRLQRSAGRSSAFGFAGLLILVLLAVVGLQPFDVPSAVQALTGEGDLLRQAAYVGALCLIMMSGRTGSGHLSGLPVPLLMLALLFWCALSILWSIEPSIAARRFGLTVIMIVSIFVGVERVGVHGTIKMLNLILPILLILNYIAVFALPVGVHGIAEADPALVGNWRGLTDHKNYAGALGAITILSLLFIPQKNKYVSMLLVAAAGFFVFKTQSKTSMALLAPSILFGFVIYFLGFKKRVILALLLIPITIIGIVLSDVLTLASSVLSDPDLLTGRSVIWAALIEYASQNLIGGAGFGSFWNVGPASPLLEVTNQEWVAGISSGHSGYLDFLVQTGLPGLFLAILATMVTPLWQVLVDTRIPRRVAAFCGAVLVFFVGHNFSESSLMDRDAQMWVFALFALALIRTARANVVDRVDLPPPCAERQLYAEEGEAYK